MSQNASDAEVKKPSKDELIKEIDRLPLVKPEIKELLKANLDLPERVQELEQNMIKIAQAVQTLPDQFVAKMMEKAKEREQQIQSQRTTNPQNTQGLDNILGNPTIQQLLPLLLGGGGQSEMDKFFWRLGQETFFKGLAWQDVFMKEQARKMGKAFMSEWETREKEMKKQLLEGIKSE